MAVPAHFLCILDYVYLANVINSFFSVDIYILFKYVYKHNMVCTHFFFLVGKLTAAFIMATTHVLDIVQAQIKGGQCVGSHSVCALVCWG